MSFYLLQNEDKMSQGLFDYQNYDMIGLFIINFQRLFRKPQFEGVKTAVRSRRSRSTW